MQGGSSDHGPGDPEPRRRRCGQGRRAATCHDCSRRCWIRAVVTSDSHCFVERTISAHVTNAIGTGRRNMIVLVSWNTAFCWTVNNLQPDTSQINHTVCEWSSPAHTTTTRTGPWYLWSTMIQHWHCCPLNTVTFTWQTLDLFHLSGHWPGLSTKKEL